MNDMAQLSSGLYGPIIVLPPSEKYDPETDKTFLMSRDGRRTDGEFLLNGVAKPQIQKWRVGTPYRLRFINMNANNTVRISPNSKRYFGLVDSARQGRRRPARRASPFWPGVISDWARRNV
jgi:FtsP/CotA-like multicopper oxidase with cupredoxin domain